MGFAGAYLQKAALHQALVREAPHPGLHLIITLPVHRESGLERCLDSLFLSLTSQEGCLEKSMPGDPEAGHTEVLILFNASEADTDSTYQENLRYFRRIGDWCKAHAHSSWTIRLLVDHALPAKHAGVGLARKILMDEAVRRFDALGRPGGIIASLDADVVVDPSYLPALVKHFQDPSIEGSSIYFEHPLSADADPFFTDPSGKPGYGGEAHDAIARYELHLRYYLQSVRATGYPHAHHTVGSAFAVRALAYCQEGGMNKRQGGEDFYFIQKLSQRGHWSDCTSTRVVPSPRPSDRVPFGTGPVVARLMEKAGPEKPGVLNTYHPRAFEALRAFFARVDQLPDRSAAEEVMEVQDKVLQQFLEDQGFKEALEELRSNSASAQAFRKRFWRWFTPFRIMKFLHYARERGYPDVAVEEAAADFIGSESLDARTLLEHFRQLDRS